MELRQLKYFAAVAEELHFGKAAEKLHISQPPLSESIKRLEHELGVRLFNRSTRKVGLTPAGTVFRDHVNGLLRDLDEAIAETTDTSLGRRGRVRVGFASSANNLLLPSAVRRFTALHPQITVDLLPLTTADQVEGLLEGRLDIGLLRDPDMNVSLRYTDAIVEDLIAAIPDNHPLAAHPAIGPTELLDTPMILFPYALMPGFVSTVLRVFKHENRMPQVIQQAVHQETILGLVAAGVGFSILPTSASNTQFKGVQCIPITSSPKTRLVIAEPFGTSSESGKHFIQCLLS